MIVWLIVDISRRQALLLKTLTVHSNGGNESPSHPSPFGTLVKRLQESLTRMESFEVVTVSPGGDGKCNFFPHRFLRLLISLDLYRLPTQFSIFTCSSVKAPTGWRRVRHPAELRQYHRIHPRHCDLPSAPRLPSAASFQSGYAWVTYLRDACRIRRRSRVTSRCRFSTS